MTASGLAFRCFRFSLFLLVLPYYFTNRWLLFFCRPGLDSHPEQWHDQHFTSTHYQVCGTWYASATTIPYAASRSNVCKLNGTTYHMTLQILPRKCSQHPITVHHQQTNVCASCEGANTRQQGQYKWVTLYLTP